MNADDRIGETTPESARARRALLAHMRHELRTPLNAILGYSEMLMEDAANEGQSDFTADLERIHTAGTHLVSLVNDILDPARIEAGSLEPEDAGARIRHQLRTPLDSVIGYSEMMMETASSKGLLDRIPDLRQIRAAGLRLLELMDDIIHFASAEPGAAQSSPQVEAASSLIQGVLTPVAASRGTGVRLAQMECGELLVVDDNAINRDILSRYLERRGHQVTTAAGGKEALALLAHRHFDLILLDIMMPEMNGYQVIERLKADNALGNIPVIFISALDDAHGKVQAFKSGGADYVTKPFQAEEVIARVENQLKISRLQKDLERQNRELLHKNEELIQAHKRTALVFSALAESLPGSVLDEKYRLGEKIGTGGFGTVFRGTCVESGLPIAIKVFRPVAGNDTPDALERFRQEGIAASRIKHPNAVEILDHGISSTGIAYLVMELLQGNTLATELQQKRVLDPRRSAEIIVPVCEALAEVHAADMVHRDIKPENIYLHQGSNGEVVKLLDFGISKMLGTVAEQTLDQTTRTGQIVGTPAYMAPERLSNKQYDGRSDVYSLGIILYWMLCGKPPFACEPGDSYGLALMHLTAEPVSLRDHNPDLSPRLDALVRQTLSKDPQQRPAAKALAGELRRIELQPPQALPGPPDQCEF